MKPDVFPAAALALDEPPPLSQYARRLLAEGDSWFSLGSVVPGGHSNLLLELEFGSAVAIVDCAAPGDSLQRMVDRVGDPHFDRLLRGPRHARAWDAVLVSAGGNDLVEAVTAAARWAALAAEGRVAAEGPAAAASGARLLRTAAEAARRRRPAEGAARYVSEPAWRRFAAHLYAHVRALARRRDQGPSAGRPLVLHTYHAPVVRPAGTLGAPDGWLHPALERLGLPHADRQPLSDHLFDRLRSLLLSFDQASGLRPAVPGVHVFDSARARRLRPARAGSTGDSGDWSNEIHPNRRGWQTLGAAMGPWLDDLLARHP